MHAYVTCMHSRELPDPLPISTLGGWHPETHGSVLSLFVTIPFRSMAAFATARYILFQRHAALLITGNAACLLSGWRVPVLGYQRQ